MKIHYKSEIETKKKKSKKEFNAGFRPPQVGKVIDVVIWLSGLPIIEVINQWLS